MLLWQYCGRESESAGRFPSRPCRSEPALLFPVDVKVCRAGNSRTPRLRARSRTKIRCAQKQIVSLRIDGHGLGAVLGLNGVQRAQFVSRVFMEDVDLPGAARSEHCVGVGIEDTRVHSLADRE